MAEEPMLGLFDGETNFLDELAGTGSGDLGPSSGLDDGSMMGGSNTGMPPGIQHMQQGQPQQGEKHIQNEKAAIPLTPITGYLNTANNADPVPSSPRVSDGQGSI